MTIEWNGTRAMEQGDKTSVIKNVVREFECTQKKMFIYQKHINWILNNIYLVATWSFWLGVGMKPYLYAVEEDRRPSLNGVQH